MSKGKWLTTTERRYIRKLYDEGALLKTIAGILDRNEATISRAIQRLKGVHMRGHGKKGGTPAAQRRYIERTKHLTCEEVARQYGCLPLPCPFCAGQEIEMYGGPRPYMICLSCGSRGPIPEETYRKHALETRQARAYWLWNQREREKVQVNGNTYKDEVAQGAPTGAAGRGVSNGTIA